ncbi:hypothetical protein ACIQI7_08125 [Kitasatospora sp. NPDC092039]|uniref:hypothetical protein n=1 Tax=Kitasatospora sp. NPDC092039 TaxID=3364086 RepID=UPI0038203B41
MTRGPHRSISVVPVAVIAVDVVPGLCPPWYAVHQGLSALALAAVAVPVPAPAPAPRL